MRLPGNLAGAAMKEVKAQLQEQGGQGKVWVADWNNRFSSELGSLRHFLESRNDIKIIPGAGNKFTVALASSVGNAAKGKGKAAPAMMALTNGGAGNNSAKPKAKAKAQQGWGSGGQQGWNPLVGEAIREIKAQLVEQGGAGKVFVDQWKSRFGDQLGELRFFMESRPDKFKVIPGAGKSYTVAMATGGSAVGNTKAIMPGKKTPIMPGKPKVFTPAAFTNGNDPMVGEAIREIKAQLQQQGGIGNVWINNWKGRFEALGSLREFMVSRPDKFTVIPVDRNKFIASLPGAVDALKDLMGMAVAATGSRKSSRAERGPKTDGSEPAAKKSNVAKKTPEDLAEDAKKEAIKQLKKPGNTEGKVWFADWNRKYKDSLGKLRDFLEQNPDTFSVEIIEGTKYKVQLLVS